MTTPSDPAIPRARWRRFLKYSVGIVGCSMLLVFLAALVHGLWPRVLEEFRPISSEMVGVEFRPGEWTVDSRGYRAFKTVLSLASEGPFELTISHRGPIRHRDGERVVLDGTKMIPIGTVRPARRLIGHNYVLYATVLASSDGRLAVEFPSGQRFETDLLAGTSFDSTHELVRVNTGELGRVNAGEFTHRFSNLVGIATPTLHFAPIDGASQSSGHLEYEIGMFFSP